MWDESHLTLSSNREENYGDCSQIKPTFNCLMLENVVGKALFRCASMSRYLGQLWVILCCNKMSFRPAALKLEKINVTQVNKCGIKCCKHKDSWKISLLTADSIRELRILPENSKLGAGRPTEIANDEQRDTNGLDPRQTRRLPRSQMKLS